jgi:DNA-binding FadR family transcriptional regulator
MKKLLYVDIVSSIESEIVNGKFSEGSRLSSERELAAQFNVSRNVVREAIKVLNEKGFVDIQVGRGVFVKKPEPKLVSESLERVLDTSITGMEEILEVREVLELAIIKRVILQATDEDIFRLKNVYQKMDLKKFHVNEFVELDALFHLELAKATKNNVFNILSTSFSELSNKVIQLTIYNPMSVDIAQEQHWQLIEAIENRDVTYGEKVMRIHIEAARKDIQILKNHIAEQQKY